MLPDRRRTGTINRWGDYTAMCLDPSDDATFWFTNEDYNTIGLIRWKTKSVLQVCRHHRTCPRNAKWDHYRV